MQRLLIVGLIAIVLFAASAATSLYLRQTPPPSEETPAAKKTTPTGTDGAEDPQGAASAAPVKPAVRPAFNPQSDTTVQIAANLTKQTEALRAREQALATRHKTLDLAYQDIRNERSVVEDLRKKLTLEVSALEAKTALLEQQSGSLEQERQKTLKQSKELKETMGEYESGEQERVKQLAIMYDAMAPASAAKILQQMSDTGKIDTVVKILAAMKERQVAKVMAEATDPAIAGQWMEKLKSLKRPAPAAPKK